MPDKYSAIWLSHSSIRDFRQCPRAYYLNNVYKDHQTGHKIQIMSPPLALGQAVHGVIERLSALPAKERLKVSLVEKFEQGWQQVSGLKGGFFSPEVEERYKARGRSMLQTVMKDPGPITALAVKIAQDLPYYWLSEADELILCGKVDWLEYLEASDSVHIIDFKTSRSREEADSLQLPIYALLVTNTQQRQVSKISYWYLDQSSKPIEQPLPDLKKAYETVLAIGKQIRLARKLNRFKCPKGESGCKYCQPLERILAGEGQLVDQGQYGRDIYVLKPKGEKASEII